MIIKNNYIKKIIAIVIVLVSFLIIIVSYIASNDYLMFKMYYNIEKYDSALEKVLQLDNSQIIELAKELKDENLSFTLDVLTSIDKSIFNEEIFNIYIEILDNTDFNKIYLNKIVEEVKKEDANYESTMAKKIIYKYCCSYINNLEKSNDSKKENESHYTKIIGYLKKINDYEDSSIIINKINFDMANYYLDLGKNSGTRYDLMIEYFDKVDSKYLKTIDTNNIVNIANIYFEIAEKYTSVTLYAYSEPYYEKAINILKINEKENNNLIKKYEKKFNHEKKLSKKYEWCEAYGCARKKEIGHLHYCSTHQKNPKALTPVQSNTSHNNSGYSNYHKCEYKGCNNYASQTKYCSKHNENKCSKVGCNNVEAYQGAGLCREHLYNEINKRN